jgi:uncharacterized delta-60 repeat protein
MGVPLEGLEARRLLAAYHLDRAWADLGTAPIEPAVQGDLISLAFAHEYPDGSVLGVGEEINADVSQPALVRLLPTGSIDTSFGTGGIRRAPLDLGIHKVEFAGDGSFYAGGLSHDFTQARLAHFFADGTPDGQFGDVGVVTIQTSTLNGVGLADVAPLAGGKVLVLAYEIDTNNLESNGFLYRLNSDGSFDATFGDGGAVPVPVAQFTRTISVQPDDKIVLGGAETFMRLLPDGSMDSTFGNDGILTLQIDRTKSESRMLADGRFLTTTSYYGQDLNLPAEIRRFTADGTLDSTFGNNGIAIFSTGDATIFDLKIDGDGNIITYGQSGTDDEGFGPVLARYTPDGQPDQTFAENGALRLGSIPNATPGRMELEADGSILLTAGSYPGGFLAKVTSAAGQEVFLSDNGTLFVDGTDGNDVISVVQTGSNIEVTRNGEQMNFQVSDVRFVAVAGAGGNDQITTNALAVGQQVITGSGDDELVLDGKDNIDAAAGAGNDILTINGAAFCDITAGDGDDEITASGYRLNIVAGEGNDTVAANAERIEEFVQSVNAGGGANLIACSGSADWEIFGGDGPDSVRTGDGNDSINVGDGDNTVGSGEGDDRIFCGVGDDQVRAGDGNDSIFGGAGNDSLYGNAGADYIWGEEGRDLLSGGGGRDHLAGGAGADRLYGGRGNDLIDGGSGKDHLYGQDGDDKLNGSLGDDTLVGGTGSDQLLDSRGDDQLVE